MSFELLLYFYITKDDTTELVVILNSFNVVQFAHARHSSSKLDSALAQSQISGSVRGERQEKARGEMLKQVIRLRSSKTSFIIYLWYGQHDKRDMNMLNKVKRVVS